MKLESRDLTSGLSAAPTSAVKTSMDAVIEEYKKHVDLTLIRENLRLTVQQRFENLMALQTFAEELRRAGKRINKP